MTAGSSTMTTALTPRAANQPVQTENRTIVLKSCYGKTGIKMYLEPCRDGRTGRFLGVAALSEEQKRNTEYVVVPGETRLEITDGYTFDLRDPRQATDWAWVRHCPQIVDNRDEANYHVRDAEESRSYEGSDNEFYVHDEESELAGQEARFDKQFEALKVIHELKGKSAYYQFARLLGSNMETSSVSAVRTYLQSQAQRFPDRVLQVQKDMGSGGKVKLFLYAALDKQVIRKRAGVYYYNEMPLGSTEEQVLYWLSEAGNYTLVRAMQLELYPSAPVKSQVSQANLEIFSQANPTSEQHQHYAGALQPGEVAPEVGNGTASDASAFEVEGENEDLDANDPTRDATPPLPRAAQRRQARNA